MPIKKTHQNRLTLMSPINGVLIPLTSVPDAAFAEKMVGDGMAIDPIDGRLCAPCEGTVSMVHPACHAISLLTEQGLEVLLHTGIDTVKLSGQGFSVKVKQGQRVQAGDLLLEFDLDLVAQKVPSLMTPVLITNMELISQIKFADVLQAEVGAELFTVDIVTESGDERVSGELQSSDHIAIVNPSGIHARPAAYLVKVTKSFNSQLTLVSGQRSANLRSVVALMGMNIAFGEHVVIQAQGDDAMEAISACEAAIQSGLGEQVNDVQHVELTAVEESSLLFPKDDNPSLLMGVMASPGQSVGSLLKIENSQFEYPETDLDSDTQQIEFELAIQKSKESLNHTIAQVKQVDQSAKADILAAHLELLSDPALQEEAMNQIENGASAPAAWQAAINQQVDVLEGLNNPLMQARAADLRDVAARVIRQLLGLTDEPMADLPADTILVSQELTPSEVAALDPAKVVGVVTTGGGATSHAAILARSQGIPMLAAADLRILDEPDGTVILLNASLAQLQISPSDKQLKALTVAQQAAKQLQEASQADALKPAITQDGVEIEVAANIGNVKEAAIAAEKGAMGIGLLRSEFLFMDRITAPNEEVQFTAYQEMLQGIGSDKPAIVRTLDVGGDKPLAYLPLPAEDNPFLGERGIRICLDRPSILRTQFRALLRAAPSGRLRIMLPMIGSVDEFKLAKKVLDEERVALKAPEVELGIMIEVPSAAMMADVLAQHADFFSIGSNDLTQYTLAIDRGNARLAPLADSLHPAVLRMIDMTVKGAKKYGKWVGVCGGMAGEAEAQPILLGLGVDELSVSVPALAETKFRVRALNMNDCKKLAKQALQCDSAKEVRNLAAKVII